MIKDELIARRRSLQLTQAELAQRLGVTVSTVSHWEQGRQRIPLMVGRMLQVIEGDLRQEPVEVRAERNERWLRRRKAEIEANTTPEQEAAAEAWFSNKRTT